MYFIPGPVDPVSMRFQTRFQVMLHQNATEFENLCLVDAQLTLNWEMFIFNKCKKKLSFDSSCVNPGTVVTWVMS